MSSPLVLITGATGHVGFAVLTTALEAGYTVRAAVRSAEKEKVITSNSYLQSLNIPSSRLTFVNVPDLTSPGAYDSAVKDVEYVIHVASPIPSSTLSTEEEFETKLTTPAVQGTLAILESVAKTPSVKRVVITSSVVAVAEFATLMSNMTEPIDADARSPDPKAPFGGEFQAYIASKTMALNAAEKWVKEKKPHFDVVHIYPSGVIGGNKLAQKPEETTVGSNGWVFGPILGNHAPFPMPGATVHLDDIARLHVEALQTDKIPAGSYFGSANEPRGSFEGVDMTKTTEIVARLFPDAVKNGTLPNNGTQPSLKQMVDCRKTEKTFGWELKGFEEQVKDAVTFYLELVAKA
jgi:nucleoside-diphosphate-sugar epimerase